MMDKTRQRAVLLAIVLGQGCAGAVAQAAPSGATLLREMARAERAIQYEGQTRMSRSGTQPIMARVWRSGPKRRLEFLEPPVMKGDLLVDDGTNVWRYHRTENTAVQTKTAPRRGATDADLNRLLSSFDAKTLGQDTVAGRPTWVVAISRRGEGRPVRKFWIDKATKARLRAERLEAGGRATEGDTLQNVKFTAVAATRFSWSPPAGADVKRTTGTLYSDPVKARRAASWLRIPGQSSLPTGYDFESAVVDAAGNSGQGEAWLRYTNGLSRFSIFQQRTGSAAATEPREVNSAWYWQQGGSRFLVVGLAATPVKKLAAGMK